MIKFKNAGSVLSTMAADVYVCPADTTAIVVLCQAANVTSRADSVSVSWVDASANNVITRLANNVPIPAYEAQGMLTGKLVLEAGDKICGACATPNVVELTVSVLEMS